ncbi:MAG: CHASE2 domain-containing protein [bacterium]
MQKHAFTIKLVIGAAAVLSAFSLFQYIGFFEKLELGMLDSWFALRGEVLAPKDVVLILVDEETVQHYGGWPIPRRAYTDLLTSLSRAEPAAIVFDIAFYDVRDASEARAFARTTKAAQNVVHLFEFEVYENEIGAPQQNRLAPDVRKYALRLPAAPDVRFYRADAALFPHEIFRNDFDNAGHVTVIQDADGHFRRTPLAIDYGGLPFPAIGLAALLQYQHANSDSIGFDRDFWGQYYELRGTRQPGIKIPVNKRGQTLLNFYGDLPVFHTYSFLDALQMLTALEQGTVPSVVQQAFREKIVIVALDLAGEEDCDPTPFSACFSGAGFHATMIANALEGAFIRESPVVVNVGIVLGFWLCVFFLARTFFANWQSELSVLVKFAFALLISGVGVNYVLFRAFADTDIWLKSFQINLAIALSIAFVAATEWLFLVARMRELHARNREQETALALKNEQVQNRELVVNKLETELESLRQQLDMQEDLLSRLKSLSLEVKKLRKGNLDNKPARERRSEPALPADKAPEAIGKEIKMLLKSHEVMLSELNAMKTIKEGELQELQQSIEQVRHENNALKNDIREREKEIARLRLKIDQPETIAPFHTLVFQKDKKHKYDIKIIGDKGESKFIHLPPSRMVLLFYLAMPKSDNAEYPDDKSWIVREPVKKIGTLSYEIGREDDFIQAAKDCNYNRFQTTVEYFAGMPSKRQEHYKEWEEKLYESILNDPADYIKWTVNEINKKALPYGDKLIGEAADDPPYGLLVSKIRII